MEQQNYYLKLNVALEALIDRWYAWSHLVSPAMAAAAAVQGRFTDIRGWSYKS